jgi:hypothetical protein
VEAPESIVTDLKSIRPTFELRWNSRARYLSGSSFDVNGNPRKVAFDPRWELWDRDADGVAYKVMTLEEPETGGFIPPGEWLPELLRLIDPARYDGDVSRMLSALVDDNNEHVRRVCQEDWERLMEAMANYYTPAKGGGIVTVL